MPDEFVRGRQIVQVEPKAELIVKKIEQELVLIEKVSFWKKLMFWKK